MSIRAKSATRRTPSSPPRGTQRKRRPNSVAAATGRRTRIDPWRRSAALGGVHKIGVPSINRRRARTRAGPQRNPTQLPHWVTSRRERGEMQVKHVQLDNSCARASQNKRARPSMIVANSRRGMSQAKLRVTIVVRPPTASPAPQVPKSSTPTKCAFTISTSAWVARICCKKSRAVVESGAEIVAIGA